MNRTIAIIGFVQALFGILIFITKRPKHLSFTFLIIWLAIIAIFLGSGLLPFQVVDYFKPGILPFLFLFGPLLYLYVSSLVIEQFNLKSIMLLHLLPFLAVSIHRSTINVLSITSPSGLSENPSYIYIKIYYSLLILSSFIYWFFCLQLVLKYRKNLPFHFSNYTTKNSLIWLISILTMFLFLLITNFLLFFLDKILEIRTVKMFSLGLNLTIFSFVIIFFGNNQSVIYESKKVLPVKSKFPDNPENDEEKYSRIALNEKQKEELSETVFQYLKKEKPYLNPEYSLQMMADDLNISRHKLSQIINSSQKKNFYKFINEFRVEEVKEKLVDPAFNNFNLLGIALECGFNSKTSFNRIFKEITGLTPSEYKNSI